MTKEVQKVFMALAMLCYAASATMLLTFVITGERWQAIFLAAMALFGSLIVLIVMILGVEG